MRLLHDAEQVGMAAPAFDVVGVHRPAVSRRQGVLEVAVLVERVGVQRHRQVGRLGHSETGVHHCRAGTPVLVHLEATAAGKDGALEQLG